MPEYAACCETMLLYLRARIPFILFRTDERDRAMDRFRDMFSKLNIPIYYHTLSQGVREVGTKRVVSEDRTLAGALDFAGEQFLQRQNLTFVLTDVQDVENDTPTARQLLDVVTTAADRGGAIVVTATSSIWPRLQRRGMTIELDPPNEDEMKNIIMASLAHTGARFRSNGGSPRSAKRRRCWPA